MQEITIY